MKTFSVAMPFTGVAYRRIEAETEEQAIEKFLDESTFNMRPPKDETDVEIEELKFCERIVEGNVFRGVRNRVEVEEI